MHLYDMCSGCLLAVFCYCCGVSGSFGEAEAWGVSGLQRWVLFIRVECVLVEQHSSFTNHRPFDFFLSSPCSVCKCIPSESDVISVRYMGHFMVP